MTLLLGIIYVAFISLGLPDALLGAAWPSIQGEMGVPVSFAGIISIIISGGTIISSLFSDALTKRLGTGKVTAISVAVTAGALWGFSVSNSFWMLCVIALPYGLGAGAVDAALNNYVALHYEARHMSWLHCFWGVWASVGPYIMGACLVGGLPWTGGYRIISLLQMGLTAALFATLSLWKSGKAAEGEQQGARRDIGLREVFKLSGAKEAMVSFFCYCALELTAGLWAASYMVLNRGLSASAAAKWASLFYLGITMGRFVCGFITMKLNDRNMVRLGQAVTVGGIAMPMPLGQAVTCAGLVMVGVGCAPVYPALLHETPANFGEDVSQAIMGMQMACAYVGSMVMPSLFGMLSGKTGIWLYPFYLLAIMAVMVVMVERLNKLKKEGEV